MTDLHSSLKAKANAVKGPSLSGPMPAQPAETPNNNAGSSIADSKAQKNAGAAAESSLSDKVRAVNQKLEARGYSLPDISPGTQDKVNSRF